MKAVSREEVPDLPDRIIAAHRGDCHLFPRTGHQSRLPHPSFQGHDGLVMKGGSGRETIAS